MATLTPKQKKIVAEIREVARLAGLDLDAVCAGHSLGKTTALQLLERKLIRAEVIHTYTLIDEILACSICGFYFTSDFPREWKRKPFQLFNYHVIEELSLLQKLRFVKSIKPRVKRFAGDIEALNALRNGLAHAFFPENLKKNKPLWKGLPIFSLDGMKRFANDSDELVAQLVKICGV